MNLQETYSRENFLTFIKDFIPDFKTDIRSANTSGLQVTEKATYLGESQDLDLSVFEITHVSTRDARVKLAMDGFRVMKTSAIFRALIIYRSDKSDDWRLSLMTATPSPNQKGGVSQTFSSPRRFSFFLGPNAKTNTPNRFLIKEGPVKDFTDLQKRFSLEVVNKEFYKGISESFIKLVGGEIGTGKNKKTYNLSLKLPSNNSKNKTTMEFAVRLIGRIIFCWFLREKKGQNGVSLMPKELLSSQAILKNQNYYHSILEPIFFEVLNKENKSREEKWTKEPFSQIPYLNGGLFSPQYDDHYDLDRGILISRHINTLVIPDTWFIDFFNILESYNFTIDENTSFDEELSIDPEMLGRIFENLLAEINPETGESARKSTGSYYTPRAIVDYMIDESLVLFLKQKTEVEEGKIRALISYDLTDDEQYPLKDEEKQEVINALEELKLLDPACGSGAFPMGALQKIVYVLQRVDPDAQLWFNKQIANTAPEIRRVIEREFKHKNFDYIRKLGIIRENIYGVDIQTIAIEISRLRCFLTLVVDERIDDSLENRGIEPLPNLDFKFVVANSLISLKNGQETTEGLFKDQEGIDRLKSVREQYFNATNSERYRLQNEFSNIQKQMLDRMIQLGGKIASDEMTHKLSLWEPFSNKLTSWFDSEWMFGIEDGFDIVIANPPYIKEYVHRSVFNGLRDSPYYQGKMDLWYLFACKGIDLAKSESGIISFIAQNNWVTSFGASKMRNKVVSDTQIMSLIDFGDFKIFQAGIQTMVMIFKKNQSVDNYSFDFRRLSGENLGSSDIIAILKRDKFDSAEYLNPEIKREEFKNKLLTFSNSIETSVLEKISSRRNFRLDANNEVAQGIVAPQDYVNKTSQSILGGEVKIGEGIFVLTSSELENLNLSRNDLSLVKPFYTTDELKRWNGHSKNDKWIIYTDSSFKNQEKIEKFPGIKRHLDRYENVITSDNKPYGLHRARDPYFFTGEKIFALRKCTQPTFTYTDFDSYVSATFYAIKTDRINLKYLIALLNSKLMAFWLRHKGKMQGNNYQIDKEPILDLPIYKASDNEQRPLINLVDEILSITEGQNYLGDSEKQMQVKTIEKQIDDIVYKLYGLTEDEIKIIENSNNGEKTNQ